MRKFWLGFLVALLGFGVTLGAAGPAQSATKDECVGKGVEAVSLENERRAGVSPGTFQPSASSGDLQVYTDENSVACGEVLNVHVGSARAWELELWRIGSYGGHLAREVWRGSWNSATGGPITPIRSQGPLHSADYGYVTATTGELRRIPIQPDYLPGLYFVRAVTAEGQAADAPVVIRTAIPSARRLFVESMSTAAMYNDWGGASAYKMFYVPQSLATWVTRPQELPSHFARKVSTRKPWASLGDFTRGDIPLIAWIESTGRSFDYASDLDLDSPGRVRLPDYRLLAFGQHAEYFTPNARGAVIQAIERESNVAFLGSNNLYWRESATYDDGSVSALSVVKSNNAGLWSAKPETSEQLVIGAGTSCVKVYGGKLRVAEAATPLLRGLPEGLGRSIPGLFEDELDSSVAIPGLAQHIVAESTKPLCAKPKFGRGHFAQTTVSIHPSGGAVFEAGGFGFACAVLSESSCPPAFGATRDSSIFARTLVGNVLDQMEWTFRPEGVATLTKK